MLELAIVDGARPDSRRIVTGFQNLINWTDRLAAHPLNIPPRGALSGWSVMIWLSMKIALRRGGPLCPPARFDMWLAAEFTDD